MSRHTPAPPFTNTAHRAIYGHGKLAALQGLARTPPYQFDNPATHRCRDVWLAGYDIVQRKAA